MNKKKLYSDDEWQDILKPFFDRHEPYSIQSNEKDDRRLITANTDFLLSVGLVFEPWSASKRRDAADMPPEYGHDHCEFCGTKFSIFDGDLKDGYVTSKPLDSGLFLWICPDCHNDFDHLFNWKIVEQE
jgi:hypothetical protein